MNFDTQQALLSIKGISRGMREEAEGARNNGEHVDPAALEQYAAMLDKPRETLEAEEVDSFTKDDTLWLKTVMKGLERCVACAEATGAMISVGEIRGVIEAVNDAKAQRGDQ